MRIAKLINKLKELERAHGNISVIIDGASVDEGVDGDFRFSDVYRMDVQKMPVMDADRCRLSEREYKHVVLNPTKLSSDKEAAKA